MEASLRASPIQDHFKFVTVPRPPNCNGMDGTVDRTGKQKPGLLTLLDRIYLGRFIENTKQNLPVKKCLMLFRTEQHMLEVHDYVKENLSQFKDNSTKGRRHLK